MSDYHVDLHKTHKNKEGCCSCFCAPCKSLIHDKHEAFRFKYDTDAIKRVEKNLMPGIKFQLYCWTIIYYAITFIAPYFFDLQYCGKTYDVTLYFLYGGYTALNSLWEIYTVLKIQRYLKKKSILKFNKWHFVELVMG